MSFGLGVLEPNHLKFNWELERQQVNQQHIQEKDKQRKSSFDRAPQL